MTLPTWIAIGMFLAVAIYLASAAIREELSRRRKP
jgi:hypothetical protein